MTMVKHVVVVTLYLFYDNDIINLFILFYFIFYILSSLIYYCCHESQCHNGLRFLSRVGINVHLLVVSLFGGNDFLHSLFLIQISI